MQAITFARKLFTTKNDWTGCFLQELKKLIENLNLHYHKKFPLNNWKVGKVFAWWERWEEGQIMFMSVSLVSQTDKTNKKYWKPLMSVNITGLGEHNTNPWHTLRPVIQSRSSAAARRRVLWFSNGFNKNITLKKPASCLHENLLISTQSIEAVFRYLLLPTWHI